MRPAHRAAPPMPLNWSQYNSDSTAQVAVATSPTPDLNSTQSLSVTDPNAAGDVSRAWLDEAMPADVTVSAAVYINGGIPAQVIARGSNLDGSGSGANFYAVQLSGSGTDLELVKDVNGTLTTLASITSPTYVNDAWLEETLDVEGSTVRAQLFDPNMNNGNGEYLSSSGQWQSTPTWALTVIDTSISGPGFVGVGRAALYTGTTYFDDFSVQAPAADQSFDATPVGSLPDNWTSYSTNSNDVVAVAAPTSPITPPSGPNVLAITAPTGSGDQGRAWLNTSLPGDLSVSAYTYIEATPAQVFARGSNLDTPSPTYYAVEVSEGGVVQLVKVVSGAETVLASVTSTSWINNIWVQETLSLNGDTLNAQVYRPDTQQYLSSNGSWQSTPTWAFQSPVTDTSIPETAGGQAGVGRPTAEPTYTGTNYFDDFTTATGMDAQDFDSSTSLPSGWYQSSSNRFSVVAAPSGISPLSAPNVLESTGTTAAQIWDANPDDKLTNAQVSVAMYLPNGGRKLSPAA